MSDPTCTELLDGNYPPVVALRGSAMDSLSKKAPRSAKVTDAVADFLAVHPDVEADIVTWLRDRDTAAAMSDAEKLARAWWDATPCDITFTWEQATPGNRETVIAAAQALLDSGRVTWNEGAS